MDTTPTSYSRRRAASGRVKGLAHLVPLEDGAGPEWRRLARTALCGFRPRRSWSATTAPVWEDNCLRCQERATGEFR